MTKRMLIDATHAEETRVVVLDGNRLEDFDVETSTKKQLKGNIYLAKVVRVEPSLQAAFVEYGGGRHGFLAFSEIHPDYYQIPVADRQRLLQLQAEEAREEAEAEEAAAAAAARQPHGPRSAPAAEPFEPFADTEGESAEADQSAEPTPYPEAARPDDLWPEDDSAATAETVIPAAAEADSGSPMAATAASDTAWTDPDKAEPAESFETPLDTTHTGVEAVLTEEYSADSDPAGDDVERESPDAAPRDGRAQPALIPRDERYGEADDFEVSEPDAPPPEVIGGDSEGGDSGEEARTRRTSRFLRNYRIQEVIKRRQILLVQVVKEERGTKGAALTTYISLAGRFCVLMPNSPRGGGISRKITSASDRRRLKEIMAELEIPQGMGLIVRTAGANRPKPEIKRDCEYLMRLWDDIRDHTLRSIAPALIYEEASLIKRAIRDVYSRDIDEVLVDGEDGWKAAHDFMRMLMPSHARKVQPWRGNGSVLRQPLFAKYGVEQQLDAMLSPTVQLRSGGYLVINQTEALVAIDVNSGRATRERGIEETALRTNLEAADEVARQLRLRDLAGLIVIDFIDMESRKHNAMVERRLKDALKIDRARIQVGHISHFGLMEMSRQRLRPSLAETSFIACPHCGGLGHVRSTESSAIHVLRAIEEEGAKARASLIMVHAAGAVVMYLLNHKRERLAEIELAYAMRVHFTADDSLQPPNIRIDRLRPALLEGERAPDMPRLVAPVAPAAPAYEIGDVEEADIVETESEAEETPARAEPRGEARPEARPQGGEEGAGRRRRRRRRRGRRELGNGDGAQPGMAAGDAGDEGDEAEDDAEEAREEGVADAGDVARVPAESAELAADADPATAGIADPAQAEQPSIDVAELDEDGLPRASGRRRGRRGGRRRGARREDAPEAAPAEAAPAAPVYSGPTPADPFGGAFDIFDMMDMDQEALPPPTAAPPTAVSATASPVPEPLVVEPLVEEPLVVEPLPAEPDAAAAHASVTDSAASEPAPALTEAPAAPAEPQAPPAPEQPAGPVVGAAIQPLVIGKDEIPAAERKRGWWKR